MAVLWRYRFLLSRRMSQFTIMALFVCGNLLGWRLLQGNLSTSRVLHAVTLADPFALLQTAATQHMAAAEALIGGLIVTLFFGLIAGRAFCSWVCPLNVVTDAANWLRQRAGLGNNDDALTRSARYWIAAAALAVSFATGIAAFEWISPIAMLHRGIIFGVGAGWTLVLAVFLFDAAIMKNGFCGHLCPLGAFYAVISRFSLFRVNHDKDRCTACGNCFSVCPEDQVLPMVGKFSSAVLSGECTNCGRCIEVCGDRAMKFGRRIRGVR